MCFKHRCLLLICQNSVRDRCQPYLILCINYLAQQMTSLASFHYHISPVQLEYHLELSKMNVLSISNTHFHLLAKLCIELVRHLVHRQPWPPIKRQHYHIPNSLGYFIYKEEIEELRKFQSDARELLKGLGRSARLERYIVRNQRKSNVVFDMKKDRVATCGFYVRSNMSIAKSEEIFRS